MVRENGGLYLNGLLKSGNFHRNEYGGWQLTEIRKISNELQCIKHSFLFLCKTFGKIAVLGHPKNRDTSSHLTIHQIKKTLSQMLKKSLLARISPYPFLVTSVGSLSSILSKMLSATTRSLLSM